jgi:hypothetical protein
VAKPRKKSKPKESCFTPDERVAGITVRLRTPLAVAATPPLPAETPLSPKDETTQEGVSPPTLEGCPRRGLCENADADPAYCRVMTSGCGAFRRIGSPTPAQRQDEKVRQHISAVRVLEGNDIPEGLRDPASLFAELAFARQQRLDREEPKYRGDFRSYQKRSPRW